MIVYKTIMAEIPKSCGECWCEYCKLPMAPMTTYRRVISRYLNERHEKCPLIEIKEDAQC